MIEVMCVALVCFLIGAAVSAAFCVAWTESVMRIYHDQVIHIAIKVDGCRRDWEWSREQLQEHRSRLTEIDRKLGLP